MDFYSSIAEVYDYIFPLKPGQADFVERAVEKKEAKILDIGCSTGSLAIELSRRGYEVTGIDSDDGMIGKAVDKAVSAGVDPDFLQLDMRKIPEHFSSTRFDAVLCCGNTLVHLTDLSDIRHFLTQTAVILARGGVLLLQIINYDRILDSDIGGLPTIENKHIKFERSYDYHTDTGLIDFRTVLTVYKTGEKIENTIPLYPLRKEELRELLHPAGFVDVEMFGGFSGSPHTADDIPLIVKARV